MHHSRHIEDDEEMNPIEYALLNSTNIKLVKMMQRASRKQWRELVTEKRCEGAPQEIAKDNMNTSKSAKLSMRPTRRLTFSRARRPSFV